MSGVSGGAAGALLNFLEQKRQLLTRDELLDQLDVFTEKALVDTNDSGLLDLLQRMCWKSDGRSFNRDIDVEELCKALSKLNQRRNNHSSTLRTSQVGARNTIKSFAPDMLMRFIKDKRYSFDGESEEDDCDPGSFFFEGVCLLADISGFTRLSGQFCDRGKDGIDQLQQATNGYMGQLVKVIYAYGGDVMKFAGDALVCVFLPGRHTTTTTQGKLCIRDACAAAIQCATELAQICTDQLTAHVAVSCGSMCFGVLGGYGKMWECLVSGECLGHLSQCLDDAPSKHTVITQECVDLLGPNYLAEIDVELVDSGNYRVISTARMNSLVTKIVKRRAVQLMKDCETRFAAFDNNSGYLNALSRFVPSPVTIGLISGNFDYLAELREVTTMFMKWDGYDEDVHHDLITLQPHFFATQKVLAESGAFLRQFLVDDKGCVLIACWGVPTASYPDNARRALCSAVIIGTELRKLGMQTSFGITTGNVFCGSVGSFVRREYAAIGDVVNLAARLMGKAKGGCLVSEVTYSRLPSYLHSYMKKMEPMAVKGKDKPITSYKFDSVDVLSLDQSTYSKPDSDALLIRAECKRPLVQELEIVAKSPSPSLTKFLLFEGGLGTGKQEAMEWAKQHALTLDVRVVFVRLSPRDCTQEYSMLSKIFRQLLREDIFDHMERQKFVVKHILREVCDKADKETAEKVIYPAMRIALGVTCPLMNSKSNSILPTKLPPSLISQSVRDVFNHLLSEQPMVVMIEDAHFGDHSSWNILLTFKNLISRALFVLTEDPIDQLDPCMSSEWLSNVHKRLLRFDSTTHVFLSDYSVVEIEQLICIVLKIVQSPDGLADLVHQLSGGNPFWCKEMIQFIESIGAREFIGAMKSNHAFGDDTNKSRSTAESSGSTKGRGGVAGGGGVVGGKTTARKDFLSRASIRMGAPNRSFRVSTTSKLELFIVCRFERLSTEDQNVLRTASIIGKEFSRDILYGILSPKMRNNMFSSIQSLVKNQWVAESKDSSAEYAFTHPLVYKTLYDLTPNGDRARMHFAIASYIEDAYENNADYFLLLTKHYGLSNDCHSKALEYAVKAANHSLQKEFLEETLDIISEAVEFAQAAVDHGSVLGLIAHAKDKLEKQRRQTIKAARLSAKALQQQQENMDKIVAARGPASLPSSPRGERPLQFRNFLPFGNNPASVHVEGQAQAQAGATTNSSNTVNSPRRGNDNSGRKFSILDIALRRNSKSVSAALHTAGATATVPELQQQQPPDEAAAEDVNLMSAVTNIEALIERYRVLEHEVNMHYEAALESNNIGIISEWMKPFLAKKRKGAARNSRGHNRESAGGNNNNNRSGGRGGLGGLSAMGQSFRGSVTMLPFSRQRSSLLPLESFRISKMQSPLESVNFLGSGNFLKSRSMKSPPQGSNQNVEPQHSKDNSYRRPPQQLENSYRRAPQQPPQQQQQQLEVSYRRGQGPQQAVLVRPADLPSSGNRGSGSAAAAGNTSKAPPPVTTSHRVSPLIALVPDDDDVADQEYALMQQRELQDQQHQEQEAQQQAYTRGDHGRTMCVIS